MRTLPFGLIRVTSCVASGSLLGEGELDGGTVAFCPSCGEENPDKAKFCLECATPSKPRHLHRPRSARWYRSYSWTWSVSPLDPTT